MILYWTRLYNVKNKEASNATRYTGGRISTVWVVADFALPVIKQVVLIYVSLMGPS